MNWDVNASGQTQSMIGCWKSEELPPIYFPFFLNLVIEGWISPLILQKEVVMEPIAPVLVHNTHTLLDIYGIGIHIHIIIINIIIIHFIIIEIQSYRTLEEGLVSLLKEHGEL